MTSHRNIAYPEYPARFALNNLKGAQPVSLPHHGDQQHQLHHLQHQAQLQRKGPAKVPEEEHLHGTHLNRDFHIKKKTVHVKACK